MRIKAVAFDLEGTVVDVERAHHESFLKVAEEIGHPMTFEEAVEKIPNFIGGGDTIISAKFHELPDVNKTTEELRQMKMKHYCSILRQMAEGGNVKPRPGFLQTLAAIRHLGLPTAIGSLTPTNQAMELFEYSGLNYYFDRSCIVLLEDVAKKKPAPDVFLKTSQIMNVSPENQLVFEDSPVGIQAAIAASSIPIAMPAYNTPAILHKIIDAGARRIFMDWREVKIENVLLNLSI